MGNRWIRVSGGILVLASLTGLLGGYSTPAEEPTYKGKSLKDWTSQLKEDDADKRRAAAQALGAIGPPARDAVPSLAALLADRIVTVREAAAYALGQIGGKEAAVSLLKVWPRMGGIEQRGLTRAVSQALRRAEGIPPVLIDLLRSDREGTRVQAARWLLRLGRQAGDDIAALREVRGKTRDETVRTCLRALLLRVSPEFAKAEVPGLMKELAGANALEAALLLASAGSAAVPSLREQLQNGDNKEALKAVLILGLIGPDARPAADDLRKLCQGADFLLRLSAAWALSSVSPKNAKEGLAVLREFLKSGGGEKPPSVEAVVVAIMLPPISPEDEALALGVLVDALKGYKEESLRALVAWGLCAFGSAAKDATLDLRRAMSDGDYFVRVCAAYALGASNLERRGDAVASLRETARISTEAPASDGLSKHIQLASLICQLIGLERRNWILLEAFLENRPPFHRFPTPFVIEEAIAYFGEAGAALAPLPEGRETLLAHWRRFPIAALEELDPAAARQAYEAQEKAERERKEKLAREETQREKEAERRLAEEKERRARKERIDREDKAQVRLNYGVKLLRDPATRAKGIERIREILRDFPGTPAAAEAKKRLQELGEK